MAENPSGEEGDRCEQCGTQRAADGSCPSCPLALGLEEQAETRTRTELPPTSSRERIGPYTILQVLGQGGMGIVYLAEQTRPIRRRVALKLIKPGMDSAQVLVRFESERQALALMSHPNVAKVFDAGVSDDGRPYFVMEHVQGVPITEYCDSRRLSVPERLGLFLQACDALQHAHQKGIIHRDVKPSNVLVCLENERAAVKVIDFGVAKATGQKLTDRTLHTQLGIIIGTPEYMSPEQAGTTVLDIDTRADIYSLGVVLYELLVGALPFDPKQLRGSAELEMLRIIREVDPPKLATRIVSLGDSAPEMARCRRTDPASLTQLISGELEWITLKALEKNPARRYSSASEFADDVRRYLHDEPVLARPQTAWYRARKFVRRHRLPVAAAAAVVVALLAGLVASTWLYVQAVRAGKRASVAADKAQAINDFLREMLRSAEPGRRGREVRLVDLLADGAAKVDTAFASQPEVRGELHATIGDVYQSLAMYAEAERHTRLALEQRDSELGPGNPATIEARMTLARTYWESYRFDEAIAAYTRTLADAERSLGPKHPLTLDSMHLLGDVYNLVGRQKEAEPLLTRALALNEEVLGPDNTQTLDNRVSLGYLYYHEHRLDESAEQYRRAFEAALRSRAPGSWMRIRTADEYSRVLLAQGRLDEAERVLDGLLDLARRELGEAHTQTIYVTASTMSLQMALGHFDEAQRLARHAVDLLRATDRGGPLLPVALRALTLVLAEQGKDEAVDVGREAVDVSRRAFGESVEMGRPLRAYAVALYKAKTRADFAASEARFGEALSLYRAAHGEEHPKLAETLHAWARMEHVRGRHGAALTKYREALEVFERLGRAVPYTTGEIRSEMGRCLLEQGRAVEAEPLLSAGYETLREKRGEADDITVLALDRLAELYEKTGRSAQAAELRRRRPERVRSHFALRTITGNR